MESTSPPTDPNFSSTRDFNDRGRRRASRRIVLRVAISVGVGLLIFLGVCGWGVNRARRNAMQISCAANLRQIGLACLMYAKDDPQGRFPPRFEDALLKEDISAVVFCCPESNDTPAKGPTTQASVDQLAAGGHLSYIYAGAGLTIRSDTNSIVAYEPLKNHHGEGMNVLFADGHIDWLTTEQAQKLSAFAQSAAGRPVRWDGKTATVGTAER